MEVTSMYVTTYVILYNTQMKTDYLSYDLCYGSKVRILNYLIFPPRILPKAAEDVCKLPGSVFALHGRETSRIYYLLCKNTHQNPRNMHNKPFRQEYSVGQVFKDAA